MATRPICTAISMIPMCCADGRRGSSWPAESIHLRLLTAIGRQLTRVAAALHGRDERTLSIEPSRDRAARTTDASLNDQRPTARRNACDAIVEALFDTSRRGIVVTDLRGDIVRVNDVFASSLAYDAAELSGKSIADISAGDHAGLVRRLLADERQLASRRQFRAADGKALWARERSRLGRDRDGSPRMS